MVPTVADPPDDADGRPVADDEHGRDGADAEDAVNDTEARYGEDESPA